MTCIQSVNPGINANIHMDIGMATKTDFVKLYYNRVHVL